MCVCVCVRVCVCVCVERDGLLKAADAEAAAMIEATKVGSLFDYLTLWPIWPPDSLAL